MTAKILACYTMESGSPAARGLGVDTDSRIDRSNPSSVAEQRVMRRQNIRRKVSKSTPIMNGAITSLVIYSLYQIVANNLPHVLNNDSTLMQAATSSRTLHQACSSSEQNIKNNNDPSDFNINCPRDTLSHDYDDAASSSLSQRNKPFVEQIVHGEYITKKSHMELDSLEKTVTKQEQRNNARVDRSFSSSFELKMIYETTVNLLSQLSQCVKQNLLKIVNNITSQLKLQRQTHYHSGVLFAQAAEINSGVTTASAATKDSIIVLNVTNFNTELIQDKHPFPHIKLIEYYLPYCGICRKFKSTYVQLAKEVHHWRNVIRPSAIDLSVTSNSPIAHSWSIEEIPTLRIHPPPSETLSNKLQAQYNAWNNEQKLQADPLQAAMYGEYTSSMPMVRTLKAIKYTNDSYGESGSSLLRSDLLEYIQSYVEQYPPTQLPKTWPNFKPAIETTLNDLMKNHDRPEMFLLVEPTKPSTKDPNSKTISLGFSTVMDLSSGPAYKAIRYMYASENKALLREIITYADRQQSNPELRLAIETLNSLLKHSGSGDDGAFQEDSDAGTTVSTNTNNDRLVLVHVDLTHQNNNTLLTSIHPIPFVHIVTQADLIKFEAQHNAQMSSTTMSPQTLHNRMMLRRLDSINRLSRREASAANEATNANDDAAGLKQQHEEAEQKFMELNLEQRIKLLTLYVSEIYTPQPEDKAFVEAMSKFDANPTSDENKHEALKLRQRTHADVSQGNTASGIISDQLKAVSRLFKAATTSATDSSSNLTDDNNSGNGSNNNNNSSLTSQPSDSISTGFGRSCRHKGASDYNDKLKAIRYSLFNEVPRRLMNPSDQREKIRTLLDLITVIKHYFPLPDSASIQFIDGVHRYLTKHQYNYGDQYATHGRQQQQQAIGIELNAQAFKRELKRLESEGKRLPEIQEWSYCGSSGYACGLWRLFHTLAAFEYKKLSQIHAPQPVTPQHLSSKGSNQQQQSEFLHSPDGSSSEQQHSQQLHQLQRHQQQLVKLVPASQTSTTTPPASSSITSSTSGARVSDKSIQNVRPNATTTMINEVTMPSPVERLVSPPATSASLSLTIATPTSTKRRWGTSSVTDDAELPTPVLLVMRDYVTNYFSCEDCAKNFRVETANISLDRITQNEAPEFTVLWLWETHNRISKRLSVDNESNHQRPMNWYPSYEQCSQCYKKPPSYLNDPTADSAVKFRESVEWDRDEILRFLLAEYTKTPMDNGLDLFGYQVPYGFVWIVFATCIVFMIIIRCAAGYIERQRRHKAATILNGNGVHYSTELQCTE